MSAALRPISEFCPGNALSSLSFQSWCQGIPATLGLFFYSHASDLLEATACLEPLILNICPAKAFIAEIKAGFVSLDQQLFFIRLEHIYVAAQQCPAGLSKLAVSAVGFWVSPSSSSPLPCSGTTLPPVLQKAELASSTLLWSR